MTDTTTQTTLDGRYRLIAQLAVGGTATVHLAEDLTLGRTVAIKVLHPHLAADPTFTDRFEREALAVASIQHPNVVVLHDVAADGRYLVMEHVDGPSLRDVLRLRGRLHAREALALIGPVAAGLQAAHTAGLVHRDVKPENVLLGTDGQVKIGDFGLARAAAGASVTFGPDAFAGSPHYTPPEAVQGAPLDARSDVYSLGILLYECLTGRPPFEADSPFATAMMHTTHRVPAPSQIATSITPELDHVVAAATSHDPAQRHADAGAFIAALNQAVPEGPTVVDVRGGSFETVVLPVAAADTVVSNRPVDSSSWWRRRRATAPASTSKKRPGRRLRRPLVLTLAAVVLLGAIGWGTYDRLIAPYVTLPQLVGISVEDASAQLVALGLDPSVSDEQRFSMDAPKGTVAAIEPDGQAREGHTVTLYVSAGPRQITVPPVDGRDESTALAIIEAEGLVGVIERRFDETVPVDLAVGSEPAVGMEVDEGSTVVIVVSRGRQPIEMPSLVGTDAVEAKARLDALGLTYEVISSAYDDEVPEGAVLTQSIEPGTTLYRGDRVELTTSDGPEPFEMPDVFNETERDARSRLEALGLVVQVTYVDALFGFGAGRVGDQQPDPGTLVRRGETVQIVVLQ